MAGEKDGAEKEECMTSSATDQPDLRVDRCYVVNLKTNAERWQNFIEGSENWQRAFGATPQRFDAVYGVELESFDKAPWFTDRISAQRKRAWGGKAGCILSHAGVIRDALEHKCDYVLVLEDDAFLDEAQVADWLEGLAPLIQSLPATWASVNLCTAKLVTPCRQVATYSDYRLLEVAGAFSTVAYLLNGHCLKQLSRELPTEENIWEWVARHKTIDRWYSQNLSRYGEVYVFSPSLVGHREGASDISMNAEEIWRVDFSLKDAPITEGYAAFRLKMAARRVGNWLGRLASRVRFWVKRRRGL